MAHVRAAASSSKQPFIGIQSFSECFPNPKKQQSAAKPMEEKIISFHEQSQLRNLELKYHASEFEPK